MERTEDIPREVYEQFGLTDAYVVIEYIPPSDEAVQEYRAEDRARRYAFLGGLRPAPTPPRGTHRPLGAFCRIGNVGWNEPIYADAGTERYPSELRAALARAADGIRDAIANGTVKH